MNLTVNFSGHVEDVIERLVEKGVVKTKSEALRLGILKLEEQYLRSLDADDLILAEKAWDDFKAGKNKSLSEREFYSKTGLKK
ncbi:MAG: hypothetical protein HY394_00550 [Candidatus Diapherotrites archaeon]|nr:hypothetical protein [Candidatus Diapherotrites archaeon]